MHKCIPWPKFANADCYSLINQCGQVIIKEKVVQLLQHNRKPLLIESDLLAQEFPLTPNKKIAPCSSQTHLAHSLLIILVTFPQLIPIIMRHWFEVFDMMQRWLSWASDLKESPLGVCLRVKHSTVWWATQKTSAWVDDQTDWVHIHCIPWTVLKCSFLTKPHTSCFRHRLFNRSAASFW